MNFEAQVIALMSEHNLPPLPTGHPIFNANKVQRFGPKKKGWYSLRKYTLKSGAEIVTGAFGINQGSNHNSVSVRIESETLSAEDAAEYAARQREFEEAAAAARAKAAHLAANRAKDQWGRASEHNVDSHAYLVRKGVPSEGLRVDAKGDLFIPMRHYSHDGAPMVGLQKISPTGEKFYNKGLDKVGAGYLLGNPMGAPLIAVGEGYATCKTSRIAVALPEGGERDLPVMVAFDAGNIIHHARKLRADFPDAHLLFLADDDFQLQQRFEADLMEQFELQPLPAIDGEWRKVKTASGQLAEVVAEWRFDPQGIVFLWGEVRCGRVIKELRYLNAGIASCHAAAAAVGDASVVVPVFANRGEEKLTDFNDLQHAESLSVVAKQLADAIDKALRPAAVGVDPRPSGPHLTLVPPSPERSNAAGMQVPELPGDFDERTPPPGGGGKGKKTGAKKIPPELEEKVQWLVENFVLLYGTNTAWDLDKRMQLKVNDMRLAHGNDAVKLWLARKARRMIVFKNLVFDPTMMVNEDDEYVNMYEGLPRQPRQGKCEKILALLLHLCNGDKTVMDWILRWIAFPLKHPGAKMASSIIMHGDEGSGKNLFWEKVVRMLYGQYGGVIGNAQIEAQFNDWASQKLFFVCDEVVTSKELRQLKGRLKWLITGDSIRINPKGLPEREEGNYINFVFLSNELQPLALDKTDRRYLVLWTPPNQEKQFYLDVVAEIENGGIEAFYHYLLYDVDCNDFDAHTKPPATEAKESLIALGLSAPERFFIQWQAGELPLPFLSCGSMQLYAAFRRWCDLNGERFPPTEAFFGRHIGRIGAHVLSRKPVKYGLGEEVKQRTVYLIGLPKEGQTLHEYVAAGSNLFEQDLRKYRHVYTQSEEPIDG